MAKTEFDSPALRIAGDCIDHVHLHTLELGPPVRLLTAAFGSQFCGSFDVPSTGSRVAFNPTSRLEVSVPAAVRSSSPPAAQPEWGREGKIYRLCFVVEDLHRALSHFEACGIKLLNEVDLPGIAHEFQFDPEGACGIPLQLGVWGPGLEDIQNDGLVRGATEFPAPAEPPIRFTRQWVDRVQGVVPDLDEAAARFEELLQVPFGESFDVEDWDVRVRRNGLGIVFMQPASPNSILSEEIAARGACHLSRVCFSVSDLDRAIAHFGEQGLRVQRTLSRDGAKVVHFEPGDSFGIGIQLGNTESDGGAALP
jgi:hypothetical protein